MKQAIEKDLPFGFAKRHRVLVVSRGENALTIAQTAHIKPEILLEIQRFFDMPLRFVSVDEQQFDTLLGQHYEANSAAAKQMVQDLDELELEDMVEALRKTEDILESEDDAPIIRLINALLSQAIKEHASDIHIETFENTVTVRFRVDGVLHKVLEPQRIIAPLLVSRIKVMAKLDIAEKRVPQDGRIGLRIAGRAIDVRVSTMPSNHGERVVLRLLDKKAGQLDLKQLGMSEYSLTIMEKLIAKPHGIILVTGPTGAGKTTTLYAALTVLNQTTRNILTVEDPVEYDLPGIGQTQVNPKVNMTFAKGLRAILRQDPDVVMIGEIRDLETAEIAVQASLTGHLVLSTLHTNSAIGAITRLRDMGVERFLLSSSLEGIIAQRLVRVLCEHCKRAEKATLAEAEFLNKPLESLPMIYHPLGCPKCNNTGYWGRTGIYDVIMLDAQLRRMVHDGASEYEIEYYVRQTVPDMRADGIRRILEGDTTIEEVIRVTTAVGE